MIPHRIDTCIRHPAYALCTFIRLATHGQISESGLDSLLKGMFGFTQSNPIIMLFLMLARH